LADNNKLLRRALTVRNPYVNCLNVLQPETLRRIRKTQDEGQEKVLKDALVTAHTGIANGLGITELAPPAICNDVGKRLQIIFRFFYYRFG